MAVDGRVLIVERLIPDDPADAVPVLLSDLNMLILTGGQERTNAEYGQLLAEAGLSPAKVQPVTAPYGVIAGGSRGGGSVACDGLEGAGDLGDAGEVEQADGEIPQRGHDLGAVPGVSGIGVFVVGGVTQPVHRLDAPLAAGESSRGPRRWPGPRPGW